METYLTGHARLGALQLRTLARPPTIHLEHPEATTCTLRHQHLEGSVIQLGCPHKCTMVPPPTSAWSSTITCLGPRLAP
ncbi:hypothetical protein DPMN_011685 [Dreissena polymorpha]|uniref:Uncharacterized protein n=1 Tax=Dreissena polymorpha TaxID=45954 RepID=A0A9D4N6L5_DREPO|nr:hypothetical protein DPMN_011685 [Dreissena polymorpha]